MAIKGRAGGLGSTTPTRTQNRNMPEINIDFMKIWASIKEHTPAILLDPISLISKILHYTNMFFT